jgi:hypothetical protein
MFKLNIYNPDLSLYWTESFNSLNALNKWLQEEQTRPYWKPGFTTEIIDQTPPQPTPDELAAIAAAKAQKLAQIDALRTRLNDLDALTDLTALEVKEAVRKIFKLLKLKGTLD